MRYSMSSLGSDRVSWTAASHGVPMSAAAEQAVSSRERSAAAVAACYTWAAIHFAHGKRMAQVADAACQWLCARGREDIISESPS